VPSLNRASILVTDDRTARRYRLLLEAETDQAPQLGMPVILHDISLRGLLFEADPVLGTETELTLEVPGVGPLLARTVWTNGSFYGAEFATPLSADRLKAVLAESKVIWPDFAPIPQKLEPMQLRALPAAAPAGPGEAERGREMEAAGWNEAVADKFSLPTRIRIIVGLTVGTWSLIGLLVWLALR
jgi:hypothetical protein